MSAATQERKSVVKQAVERTNGELQNWIQEALESHKALQKLNGDTLATKLSLSGWFLRFCDLRCSEASIEVRPHEGVEIAGQRGSKLHSRRPGQDSYDTRHPFRGAALQVQMSQSKKRKDAGIALAFICMRPDDYSERRWQLDSTPRQRFDDGLERFDFVRIPLDQVEEVDFSVVNKPVPRNP